MENTTPITGDLTPLMNKKDIKSFLTDEELEAVVTTATDSDDGKMAHIKATTEVNPDAELETAFVTGMSVVDERPVVVMGEGAQGVSAMEKAISEVIDNGGVIPDNSPIKLPENNPMTEEEMLGFVTLISKYKKDKSYPVYKNMPESMKDTVRQIAMANGIPATGWNHVACMILEEFINDSNIDEAFVDLEREIDKALEMPSVVDLYSEHTKNVMETYIPEMAEKIKDEFPDKAARLLAVKEAFTKSYTFTFAKESYSTNSRVRKMIRRWERERENVLEAFNYLNSKSNFKMNDCTQLPEVLADILIDEPLQVAEMCRKSEEEIPERYMKLLDLDVSMQDIYQFCILICESCRNMNPDDVIDASYMYYMIKNIIVLRHTQEAKTDFAIELISNICDTIVFIRNKEDEFNESVDKSKSGKKRKSNK